MTVATRGRRVFAVAGTWLVVLCGSVPASVSVEPREAGPPKATPIPVPEIAGRAEGVSIADVIEQMTVPLR